jgi:hypothetical protein
MIVMKLSRFAGVSVAGACRRNPERSEGSFFAVIMGKKSRTAGVRP